MNGPGGERGDGPAGPARRVVVPAPGPADAFRVEPFEPAPPGPGEVRVRHDAIGVNFIDVYFRTGLYPWPVESDLVTGSEAAGTIDAVGEGVEGLAVGRRVAYAFPNGAYATHRSLPAAHVVALPDGVDAETAAAVMLKGLTVAYLVGDSHVAKPGDVVLFHAAAGGVGSLAGRWLASKGAVVIGTAGGPDKCAAAASTGGYAHVIDYRTEDVAERVRELTAGAGVDAVYDGVGRDTLRGSLACLKRFGTLVSFGQSSGPADDFRISDLAAGSLRLQRPTLFHYAADRTWLERASHELFERLGDGTLRASIGQRFALDDAGAAHAALEARRTVGSTLLLP